MVFEKCVTDGPTKPLIKLLFATKSWLGIVIIVVITLRVCWSSLSTAFWGQLRGCPAFRYKQEIRLPHDAFRKQLTSCFSTSNSKANRFHFTFVRKSRKLGLKKTSLFEQFMSFLLDAFRKQLTSCFSALYNSKLYTPYLSSYLSSPNNHFFFIKY